MEKGCLYWITGLSGAGKTTIGTALYYKLKEQKDNTILLDGDVLKKIFGEGEIEYTEKARRKRARKYAELCKTLTDQGMKVICCTIAMYDEVRKWNRENNDQYMEIFLDVPMEILRQRDQKGLYSNYYAGITTQVAGLDVSIEFPKNPDIRIINDGSLSIEECVEQILAINVQDRYQKINNTDYWNNYYEVGNVPLEASDFAQYIYSKYLESGKRMLEIGCGNGRDSLYFAEHDIEIVGVDSSQKVIEKLRKRKYSKNILFVCDDFTKTNTLYQQQFDYCYSRFTLHAINQQQESFVIKSVYDSLKAQKNGGYFFIEVRSIHDPIYAKGEKVEKNAYIYEGHYRRFIEINELQQKLRDCGYSIIEAVESKGFAVYGKQDPPVIRIVAKK